jgi:acetoin utilization deacetylase AcuC-like enzyme
MIPFFRSEFAKVAFSSDYIYGIPTVGDRESFDLMKYKKIKDKLIAQNLLKPNHILKPDLCTYDDIRLVHTAKYIQNIQNPQYVTETLKIGSYDPLFNSILEYYRAVTGGTLLAAAYSLKWKIPVFNLGGGFHHARADKAEGFCLINDIAIAIQKFRTLGKASKFMIIDLDYHQGNGNLLHFKDDPNVYTFSMHADTWVKINRSQNKDILLPKNCTDETYLSILDKELNDSCLNFYPDAVFFIAGSDPYEKDTLADMNITREGMFRRNIYVYRKVKKKKLPLIIVAGGGYGPHSWEVYYDFIRYALKYKI